MEFEKYENNTSEISEFDTSKVTNINGIFDNGFSNPEIIPNLDTSKVKCSNWLFQAEKL